MTNAIAIRNNPASYASILLGVAATIAEGGEGKPILGLDKKTGQWQYGQENTPLHDTCVLAVDPINIRHGWIAFLINTSGLAQTVEGENATQLYPIGEPLPYVEDLPALPMEPASGRKPAVQTRWQFQLALEMKIIEGPGTGTELTYRPTSRGGLAMCRKLMEELARKLSGPDAAACVPLIELFNSSYEHKQYGLTYTPDCAVLEWATLDGTTAVEPQPETKHAVDQAPEQQPPASLEQPRGRRETRGLEQTAQEPERRGRGRPRNVLAGAGTPVPARNTTLGGISGSLPANSGMGGGQAAQNVPVGPENSGEADPNSVRGRAAARGSRNIQR